ncbi:MAG: hypothetical protein QW559_02485 [Candidatus Woesearchaeota archaeon]
MKVYYRITKEQRGTRLPLFYELFGKQSSDSFLEVPKDAIYAVLEFVVGKERTKKSSIKTSYGIITQALAYSYRCVGVSYFSGKGDKLASKLFKKKTFYSLEERLDGLFTRLKTVPAALRKESKKSPNGKEEVVL